MPEVFTLSQAARLLGISRRTLYGWLKDARITTRKLPTDKRAQTLTRDQIERLARAHSTAIKDESLIARLERAEARIEALEQWKAQQEGHLSPSLGAEAISRPLQSHPGAFSAPRAARSSTPGAPILKIDAARLIAARHGVDQGTAKGWPWPTEALASQDAALRWALAYVAERPPHKRPHGWRWRCDVPDCPCHQRQDS